MKEKYSVMKYSLILYLLFSISLDFRFNPWCTITLPCIFFMPKKSPSCDDVLSDSTYA